MAFLSNNVFDNGLSHITANADVLHICSAAPSSYANVAAVTLGNKSAPSIGSPADGDVSGRKVTVAAVTDGSVTATGLATHWALVDVSATELIAWQTLSASQNVTNGNPFTTAAIDIEIPDPA